MVWGVNERISDGLGGRMNIGIIHKPADAFWAIIPPTPLTPVLILIIVKMTPGLTPPPLGRQLVYG